MYKLILFIFLFTYSFSYGQSYEEKIAEKSCDCISQDSEETDNLENLLKNCIISSKIEVDTNDPSDTDNKKFTVEGIQKNFSDVSKLVIENCPSLRTKVSEKKKQEFYRLSDNQKANELFTNGNHFKDNNEFELAIKEYQKALNQDKEFVMAYDHLGVAYRLNNDLYNAIKTYKQSLKLFPEGDFALQNIAVAYSMQKNESEAQKYYEHLIHFYPENPEGYYGSGKTNLVLKNYEIALRNTLISIILYHKQSSMKITDAETLLSVIYSKMKQENELEKFNQILNEYNVEFIE